MDALRLLAAAALVLAAVACSSDPAPQPPPDGGGEPSLSATASDSDPTAATSPATDPSTSVDVGAEQRHPSGTTATVTEISVDGRAIYVGFEAFNGSPDPKILVEGERFMVLRDDVGNTYRWEPPAESARLELESGEELTARLAFIGPLRDGATSLELLVNWSPAIEQFVNLDQPSNDFDSSHFEDLPVPGA